MDQSHQSYLKATTHLQYYSKLFRHIHHPKNPSENNKFKIGDAVHYKTNDGHILNGIVHLISVDKKTIKVKIETKGGSYYHTVVPSDQLKPGHEWGDLNDIKI